MIGQFGVIIDKGIHQVRMKASTPQKVLGLPAVDSYALCNEMTLHCDLQQATPVLNDVNGPAIVVLLRCSDLKPSEIPLVQGPALITAVGGMTADKIRYLKLCSTLTERSESAHPHQPPPTPDGRTTAPP